MAFKQRTQSKELKVLRILNLRMSLPVGVRKRLYKLEKGFKGELKFDEFLDGLPGNWLTINDLMLESNHTSFQNDTNLIFQETIHIINIKNNEGNYYIDKKGDWYFGSEKLTINPLKQLERSENLFKQLLQELGLKFSVEAYLVFVNPDFYLYNAPRDLPAVFPTQLTRYKDKLLSIPSFLNERHHKLAQKLVSLHQEESPYTKLPKYKYEKLKKGCSCVSCHSFDTHFEKHFLICRGCGCKEDVESAVLRNVEEIMLLFPDMRITTNIVQEWCGILPQRTIRRILAKNFTMIGRTNSSYFIKEK